MGLIEIRKIVRMTALLGLAGAALRLDAAPGAVAQVDPALFQELRWRSIGPFRAGRVLTVSGIPGDVGHFYFGSVNGGVWETSDAGRTWTPRFDAQPIGTIGALAIAASDPKRIYVGSGEADMRSNIAQGNGLYASRDGGKGWTHIGLADTQQIGRILVDPRDADRVLVAALGHPYGPNAERGVFRSADGGATWQKVLFTNADTGAIDLAFKPGDPRTVYAALWQTRRPPWNVYPPSNGPGSGLHKSTDGGDTWTAITGHGFPTGVGRIGLAMAPTRPERVYAIVDAEAGGLYRSDDEGATWTQTSGDRRIWDRGWYFGAITVDPRDADVIYALDTAFYRSSDGGKTFLPVKGAPGGDDYHELWIDPKQPEHRILATDQGAVVTLNGGQTWSSWYNQPTGQFYHVTTDTRFPYWVYGAQQDSGAAAVPSRTSVRDGINMTHFREITAGGESDAIAPDPRDPDQVFGGRVARFDQRTEQTQNLDPTLMFVEAERSVWTLPIVFSPRDPRVLYFSRENLFRTDDGGKRWTMISPDLSRDETPRRGVIYAIAPSHHADHDVWVGTDDGLVWRRREDGEWQNVTPPALTAWSKIGTIEASRFDSETAYLAVDRHRLDDFQPYVYRTRDGGKTWAKVASGIPDGSFVNAVREDPVRRGLLYAATEKGVWLSFDDGDHWQPLQAGLPVTSVRDLVVHGDDLVIATHGRAFWILDDVTPLRQIDGAVANAQAWLFAPANAVRVRPAGFTGTPFPKDEPMAPNPPAGAAIDYVVKAPVSGPLTLDIFDAQDKLVRRYSSDDKPKAADLTAIRVGPEWVVPSSVPATAPGMHRFYWSLRHAADGADDDDGAAGEGVWAPPGRYRVELGVNGQRLSQPLTVVPDPRLPLSADAYARQFALAQRIASAKASVAAAEAAAAKLHKALAERAPRAGTALGKQISDVDRELVAAAGILPRGPSWTAVFEGHKGSLRWFSGKLRGFEAAVDGADAAPTADVEAAFPLLEQRLADALRSWRALETKAKQLLK